MTDEREKNTKPWNVTKHHNKQSLAEKDFQSNFHLPQSNVDLGVFSVISLGGATRYWIINQSLFGGGGESDRSFKAKSPLYRRCKPKSGRRESEKMSF